LKGAPGEVAAALVVLPHLLLQLLQVHLLLHRLRATPTKFALVATRDRRITWTVKLGAHAPMQLGRDMGRSGGNGSRCCVPCSCACRSMESTPCPRWWSAPPCALCRLPPRSASAIGSSSACLRSAQENASLLVATSASDGHQPQRAAIVCAAVT